MHPSESDRLGVCYIIVCFSFSCHLYDNCKLNALSFFFDFLCNSLCSCCSRTDCMRGELDKAMEYNSLMQPLLVHPVTELCKFCRVLLCLLFIVPNGLIRFRLIYLPTRKMRNDKLIFFSPLRGSFISPSSLLCMLGRWDGMWSACL